MMFHVKRNAASRTLKGFTVILLILIVTVSCGVARQTMQIPDFTIMGGGRADLTGKPLNAYIFENNVRAQMQIEQFVAMKLRSSNVFEREVWITINGDKYKMLIYDNADFEKYFNSSNFSPINEEAKDDRNYSGRKFIGISMISSYNEDCLAENSLLENIAIQYLTALKNEYIAQ